MKPKSALFISATLTTFVLAILVSVVSAFNTAQTSQVALAGSPAQETAIAVPMLPEPTTTQPAQVGPEQAASLAAQFMNKTDVYSVETVAINGMNAFKVVFSSGDIVFIGQEGQIISVTKLQPVVVVNANPTAAPRNNNHSNSGRDDHEDEDEGDDDD